MIVKAPWLEAETSRTLIDVLTAGDVPARFVGGCVRDALLGDHDAKVDLDVATPLLPDEVMGRLEAAGIKAVPTGIDHGTVTAVVDGRSFEITTLRKDIACDGRHAEVRFTDDFHADAARRDFTINALSVDRRGRLVDPFGGVEDLKAGRVRFVGDARERVREDYLRILRFFRFYARFGRPPADRQALAACREEAPNLTRLSGERIRAEMLKLLPASDAPASLTLMIENEVLKHVLPIDVDVARLRILVQIAPDSDAILRLTALLRSSPDPRSAPAAVAGWKLSTAETARLERLINTPLLRLPLSLGERRKTIYRLGEDTYLDLLSLSADTREQLDDALPVPTIPAFPLTGQDLIDRQVQPGPTLGKLLNEIEGWWLDRDLTPDRQACLQELDKRLQTAGDP